MNTEKLNENKIQESMESTTTYRFGHMCKEDEKLTNDYIENHCKEFDISFNIDGLREIEEIFQRPTSNGFTDEKHHQLIMIYHNLYIKLVRDSFGITENNILLKDELFMHFIVGKIDDKVIMLSGTSIFVNLCDPNKTNPHPDEIHNRFKEYIDVYHVFNDKSEGEFFIYDFGQIVPYVTKDVPVVVLSEINSFLSIEVTNEDY